MRTITVTRNKGWYGRFRTATILADDIEIGQVKPGKTISVQVPDQASNLYAKIDWGQSCPYPVNNLKDGQTIYMNAWFSLNLSRNIGATTIPVAYGDEPR